jgi:uncharacterized protein YxjI
MQRKRKTTHEQGCDAQSTIATATSILSKRPTTAPPPTQTLQFFLSPAISFGTPHEERAAALKVPRKTMLQVFDNQGYITTERTTLIVKERPFAFSGDSFSIKDTSGNAWFQCKGQTFSLRDKKFITDKQGQPIFVMKEDPVGWLRNQYLFHLNQNVEEGRQPEIATIIPKLTFLEAKLYVSVHNIASGSRNSLAVLKGDPYRRSASIYIGEPKRGGKLVARIVRNITRIFLFGKQAYQLVVEPGVNAAVPRRLRFASPLMSSKMTRRDSRNGIKVEPTLVFCLLHISCYYTVLYLYANKRRLSSEPLATQSSSDTYLSK